MRIFVYEHVTGGGLIANRHTGELDDHGPLLAEAAAMRHTLVADFTALDGIEVSWLLDSALAAQTPDFQNAILVDSEAERAEAFDRLAAAADLALLIAPETDGVLAGLARRVEQLNGRLASPSAEFIAWASDKHAVAETLRAGNIPTPTGIRLTPDDLWPKHFLAPAVLKPIDGCGSVDVRRLNETRQDARGESPRTWRLERYVVGQAASIGLLRGPAGTFALPACTQRIKEEGRFEYLGGKVPLTTDLAARARRLALAAGDAMPAWTGFIGLDLVLGAAEDGSEDYVIEVNPRLTTSYVGLRALAEASLARAMLDVAQGRPPTLSFRSEVVEFDADGNVRDATTRVLALDIGGANLKASDGAGFVRSQAFPLWQRPAQLTAALIALLADAPEFRRVAVTMTGELADCFRTKQAGVAAIVDAVETAFSGTGKAVEVRVLLTDGAMVAPAEAKLRWLEASASNWYATAAFAARKFSKLTGILIDIGSTTTDLIPFVAGKPEVEGRTDSDRLASGELVYTGVVRSPICAVAQALPWSGRLCGTAQELFATTRDAYLILGNLAEDGDDVATADGRPATKEFALERLARMVCADRTSFDAHDAQAMAQAVREAQVRTISAALDQVEQRRSSTTDLFVVCGQGEFLAREVLARRGWAGAIISLAEELGTDASTVGPAYALARLIGEDR
ncbi:MAG: ATP-grasp domain-containing protein [Planctomycetia bacterium]|nr:ATP-grasp domain-containing protein [Planctomycetia bacterium]